MTTKVNSLADLMVETLTQAGVRRIYGVVGDSLNGFNDALRAQEAIEWVHVRMRRSPLSPPLARRRPPAIWRSARDRAGLANSTLSMGCSTLTEAGHRCLLLRPIFHPPRWVGAIFKKRTPQNLFRECSHYCELVSDPSQMPYVLENAIRAAVGLRGVAVVAIPGDVALRKAVSRAISSSRALVPARPTVVPVVDELTALAELLNGAERVTLFT
jgi:pyruvate dehydrogenase (quinone)